MPDNILLLRIIVVTTDQKLRLSYFGPKPSVLYSEDRESYTLHIDISEHQILAEKGRKEH